MSTRRPPIDLDPEPEQPEPTARPNEPVSSEEDDKLVPEENVGGAAPSPVGLDSGGDLPGRQDDLANLAEPEPPEPPEIGAVHIRRDAGAK